MRVVIYIIFCFSLFACGPTPYFADIHELNNEKWTTEEVVTFSPSISDTSSLYELQLIIDHQDTYSYENVYFKILTKFPDREDREENLSVDLATKTGAWLGKCSGSSCKCKIYLLENFKFPALGNYTFEIRQYTRDEQLAGLNSLEMQLYKVGGGRGN